TATVDGSEVATMGWGWINVTNPVPGGGTSSNLPLTAYQVIRLDANRLTFDPFTQKLYATIPSTATQVAGNSLVAIDPLSGSLSTPLNVGSEPNRMAETSDGNYLYIGLDGSKSLTRVDLTSMTQGAVYPLTIGSSSQIAARDLAVAPNNDNLLAIDTGSFSGIGLFDISGSTGTFRANLTGPYTGSNLTFANGTTVYSYDSDTTGAEFNIWTVTGTGLTLNNNTGYTLNGIGGFAGSYQLANGLVYGFAGGVADPSTTPPTQLGQFAVDSALGSGQSVEGTGIAPAPSFERIFILGETLAGSANPVLLSYDSNTYTQVSAQQFTGFPQGQDLTRWGRDGLAWHTSMGGVFGTSTPGSGEIFLMRGPFVLPEWSTPNPTPGLVSASPSSAAAGSGNFTLTVTGSGFVPGAVLKWNGAERTTTFVDSSHLTVAIPKADLTQAGTATLVVNNPGSSDSSSISFTVN
ncbi:MAG TPA: IPT/TIG domain-containing protein, partial [Terracidiphilus sp.]